MKTYMWIFLFSMFLVLGLPSFVKADSGHFFIDFGSKNNISDRVGWNNITEDNASDDATIFPLIDSTGATSSVTFKFTDGFNLFPTNDANTAGAAASTLYPASASSDSLFLSRDHDGSSDLTAGFTIGGLDPNKIYNVRFYASRMEDGTSTNRTADYTINGQTVTLNASNNVDNFAEIQNVSPVGGSIPVSISIDPASANYGYLGVLEIIDQGNGNNNTNILPLVSAGADQTIIQPLTSAILVGSSTDPDGTIVSYHWAEASGPVSANIESPDTASTTVSGLTGVGTYLFRLAATDNQGGISKADTRVIVEAASSTSNGTSTNNHYLIDFGDSASETLDIGWNNINEANGDDTVNSFPLIDSAGNPTAVSLHFSDGFSFAASEGANNGGTNESSLYPASATADSLFLADNFNGQTDLTASYVVNGLDPNYVYDLRFFASRVAGDGISRKTDYSVGTTTVSLDATDNVNSFVQISNIAPMNGQITVTIAKDPASPQFGYLGVMEMTGHLSNVPPQNQLPVVNASQDQTIILPVQGANLTGTVSDSDGSIAGVTWSQISGPLAANISAPNNSTSTISGLTATGTYQFRLTATDNQGATSSDDVLITVQDELPPIETDDPPTINISAVTSSVSQGTTVVITADPSDDHGIQSAQFYVDGQPAGEPQTSTPYIFNWDTSSVTVGGHSVLAVAEDTSNQFGTSTAITISVNSSNPGPGPGVTNNLPIVDAGPDLSIALPITSIILVGSATDTDGTIASYLWDQLSGPVTASISDVVNSSSTVTGLTEAGTYTFSLMATDNQGATSSDEISVIVSQSEPGTDNPPTATLSTSVNGTTTPGTIVNLSASASDDHGIAGLQFYLNGAPYGQAEATTSYPLTWNTTGLAYGAYAFVVVARDTTGQFATSSPITINLFTSVTPPNDNQSPVSHTGISITLPQTSANLIGRGEDSDGSIAGYDWMQVAGPITAVIGTPNATNTTISGLTTAGSYLFRLMVTDNNGATSSSEIIIQVNNGNNNETDNQPTVSLSISPTGQVVQGNTVTLNADASDDHGVIDVDFFVDGVQIATDDLAPYYATWDSANATAGSHTMFAVAHDTAGQAATSSSITIKVSSLNSPANQDPTVSAGDNQTTTLPTTETTLTGRATDPDGYLESYSWTQVSGPVQATIASPATVSTVISGLTTVGTYVFRLTVTDNQGAIAASDVSITVKDAPVNNIDNPPSISISTGAGSSVYQGTTVNFSATASDDAGISAVQFYIDGQAYGSQQTAAPYTLGWNTTNVPTGSHNIFAVAIDTAGQFSTSTSIAMQVARNGNNGGGSGGSGSYGGGHDSDGNIKGKVDELRRLLSLLQTELAKYIKMAQMPLFQHDLKRGMSGDEVRALQQFLNFSGFNAGPENGNYSAATVSGAIRFQRTYRLPLTGNADLATRNKINSILTHYAKFLNK